MIAYLNTVGICVSNQQKAVDFYTQKLHMQIVTDQQSGDGPRWVEVAPPGVDTRIALIEPKKPNSTGTFSNLVFHCEDIQTTYHEMISEGVEFIELPERQPWGWWASFRDEDGNTFGLGQTKG